MNTIIIDDDKEVRARIRQLLKPYAFINVIEEASNIVQGKHMIEQLKPDLVFLDIQLKEGSGFKMLDQLNYFGFHLIFVAAHSDFAVKAFKYNAFDFLLKPVDPVELDNTMQRLKAFSGSVKQLVQPLAKAEENKRIVVKTAKEIFVIEMNDIVRCEASQGYTSFHLKNGKSVLSSKTLKEYEHILPANQFIRVHQSHFINLNYVVKYKREGNILLKNDDIIPVSIRKRQDFLYHFNKFSLK